MSLQQVEEELANRRNGAEVARYHRVGNKQQQAGDVGDQLFDILLSGGLPINNYADKHYTRYRRW